MRYNFSDTVLVPFLSSGLCTRPFRTPILGASRRKAKEGTKQHVLYLCSFPTSSPYPSLTFAIDFVPLRSALTFCLPCLHPNPSLSVPFFGRERAVFEPFLLVFRPLFFVAGPSSTPLPSPNACLCLKSSFFFSCRVFWTQLFSPKNSPTPTKTPKRYLTPSLNPNAHPNVDHDPNPSLYPNPDPKTRLDYTIPRQYKTISTQDKARPRLLISTTRQR